MFIDNVVIMGGGSIEEWSYLHNIVKNFCDASGLETSDKKYFIVCLYGDLSLKEFMFGIFPYKEESTYKEESMDEGFKYMGFHLKPNGYI